MNNILDVLFISDKEVQAYHEGYIEALENVYAWLEEQPRVPKKVLKDLKKSIRILGGYDE